MTAIKVHIQNKDFLSAEVRRNYSHLMTPEEFVCDVTLMSEDEVLFSAHKTVIASFSSFFKKVFTIQDYQDQLVPLSNIHSSQLSSILDYMYTGEVKIEEKCLDTFLSNCRQLKVKGHDSAMVTLIMDEYSEENLNLEIEMDIKEQNKARQQMPILQQDVTNAVATDELLLQNENTENDDRENDDAGEEETVKEKEQEFIKQFLHILKDTEIYVPNSRIDVLSEDEIERLKFYCDIFFCTLEAIKDFGETEEREGIIYIKKDCLLTIDSFRKKLRSFKI